MKLKGTIKPADFLQIVKKCIGEVWLCSTDGDRLNLKSELSCFIFVSVALQKDLLERCLIECEAPEDYALLSGFFED